MAERDEPLNKSIHEVIKELAVYPPEAFNFVNEGLSYTVKKIHGDAEQAKDPTASRHITGQELCEGLREYALAQWGMLAGTVLARWNIKSTLDFGRIVFAMVDNGFMAKTENDTLDDFKDVFDFKKAFEAGYRIESKT
jgi:uncharacterized repeat protein (TIGR04138 family)